MLALQRIKSELQALFSPSSWFLLRYIPTTHPSAASSSRKPPTPAHNALYWCRFCGQKESRLHPMPLKFSPRPVFVFSLALAFALCSLDAPALLSRSRPALHPRRASSSPTSTTPPAPSIALSISPSAPIFPARSSAMTARPSSSSPSTSSASATSVFTPSFTTSSAPSASSTASPSTTGPKSTSSTTICSPKTSSPSSNSASPRSPRHLREQHLLLARQHLPPAARGLGRSRRRVHPPHRTALRPAEVRSWFFEVWNEPNLGGFWEGADQPAYFALYDLTARTIKSIDPDLRVGGPATAGAAWIPDFLAHVHQSGAPIDFVSTHTYGVDGGFLDANGKSDVKLDPSPDAIAGDVRRVRQQISASPFPHCPSTSLSGAPATRRATPSTTPTSAPPTSCPSSKPAPASSRA